MSIAQIRKMFTWATRQQPILCSALLRKPHQSRKIGPDFPRQRRPTQHSGLTPIEHKPNCPMPSRFSRMKVGKKINFSFGIWEANHNYLGCTKKSFPAGSSCAGTALGPSRVIAACCLADVVVGVVVVGVVKRRRKRGEVKRKTRRRSRRSGTDRQNRMRTEITRC